MRPLVAILCASLATGCDPIPELYVVDGSVDTGAAAEAGPEDATMVDSVESGGSDVESGTGDAGPEACVDFSCPACPPNPGQCCPNGIPCVGPNCAADCDAGCTSCVAGEMCCAKNAGATQCRKLEGGKCP